MLAELLRAWGAVAIVGLSAYGTGAWLMRFAPATCGTAERRALALIGGLGLLGAVMFLVGQLTFTAWTIVPAVGASAVWGARQFKESPWSVRHWFGDVRGEWLAIGIVAGILVVTLIAGSSEILGTIRHDAIAYHLLGPKVWLHKGVIRPVIGNTHTAFPAIMEVVFGLLWMIGGLRAIGVISVLVLALFLGVAVSLLRRLIGPGRHEWWLAAILVTMPAVYTGGIEAFVDVFYAAVLLAALRVAIDAVETKHFVLVGVLCGTALGTKYTALLATPMVFACALLPRFWERSAPARVPWRGLVAAAAVSCVVAASFYLRNAVVLGCPIYPPPPGLAKVCATKFISAEWIREFHHYIYAERGIGLGRDVLALLALPVNLTYRTARFHGAGGIGLVPLAFLPLSVTLLWRDVRARTLALFTLAFALVWFATQQESRFLIPVYALGAVFGVAGAHVALRTGDRWVRLLTVMIVGVSVLYGGTVIVRERSSEFLATVSPAAAAARRAREIPYREAFRYLNEHATGPVMAMGFHIPVYYLDVPFVLPYDGWLGEPRANETEVEATVRQLHVRRVQYLLETENGAGLAPVPPYTAYGDLVLEAGGARVYKIR